MQSHEWVRFLVRVTGTKKKHLIRGAEVREFAPPYKASGTEAAEQCFEPIAHECEAKGNTEA